MPDPSALLSDLPLLAVPNFSEGRDPATVDAIGRALVGAGDTRLLDVHTDADHHRSVFTLAGAQGGLSDALLAGGRVAVGLIDVGKTRDPRNVGQHPHVGAVDVAPVVYLDETQRGVACAEALVTAAELGENLGVPVFLYGALAGGRTRAQLRRGGLVELSRRLSAGELRPDFGPSRPHPTAGAALVAAREPLVAFNIELAPPASIDDAKRIASLIREGGPEGLLGVRAIGVSLRRASRPGEHTPASAAGMVVEDGGSADRESLVAQVSTNVEHPLEMPLRGVVEAVAKHARVARAELVGLAPRAALEGFPPNIVLKNFDPGVHVIENALGF